MFYYPLQQNASRHLRGDEKKLMQVTCFFAPHRSKLLIRHSFQLLLVKSDILQIQCLLKQNYVPKISLMFIESLLNTSDPLSKCHVCQNVCVCNQRLTFFGYMKIFLSKERRTMSQHLIKRIQDLIRYFIEYWASSPGL